MLRRHEGRQYTAIEIHVDERGVPYSDYGTYRGLEIGRQQSVLAVAERGLWYWNTFLAAPDTPVLLSYDWKRHPKDKSTAPRDPTAARAMLVNCSEWLLEHIQPQSGFSVWTYPYPFSYGTQPGWRSAHAQAVGMQLLVRARHLTGRDDFAAPLPRLLAAFEVDVRDGGLVTSTEAGHAWYEKMADPGNEQPKVLNGLLFAILGLLDVARRAELPAARRLADAGVLAAVELLPRFDLGDWSAYDVMGRRASNHYHRIHIRQLTALADLHPTFAEYRDRFQRQTERG